MFKTIQEHGVTICFLVPTMINMLASSPGVEQYDLSSLKTMWYGALSIRERSLMGYCSKRGRKIE
ncbi:MAG: AMP-binding protein [Chloroflexota bacterium]